MPRPNATDKAKATDFGAPRRVRAFSPRGSALLYVIASIALLGAVGGGVAYFSSSSSMSDIAKTAHNQAYYAAIAGLRFARDGLSADDFEAIENSTVTYSMNNDVIFKLIVGTETVDGFPVTVCGIYGAGTSMEANYQLAQVSIDPGGGYDVELPEDASKEAGAESAHGDEVAENLIDVVTEGHEDYEGISYIRLGNQTTQGYACLWFNDSKIVQDDTTYCRNGVCKFGKGFRLYFQFQVVSPGADGFTLSFVNASNNTVNDCGGDLDMGELLAYGGPGVSGHGLRPAKIALEIDTYQNGTSSCGVSGSRYDDDDGHLAYVYWGQIDGGWSGNGCRTYDDNRHSVTGGTNSGLYNIDGNWDWGFYWDSPLRNTQNLDNLKLKTGSTVTYKRITNLEDNAVHSIRMEVERSTNTDGTGAYTLKTWYDCTVGGQPCDGLTNLTKDLTAKSPDLVSSFTMDAYFHNLLTTFLLGFTQATGASAQEVRVMNFKLRFRE